jgi:pyrroline-5-carboxylate reductase
MKKLGIIGIGSLGSALLGGLLRKGVYTAKDVVIYDIQPGASQVVSTTFGVMTAPGAVELARNSDAIVIAVKPKDMMGLLDQIGPSLMPGQTIISLAAGVRFASMQPKLPAGVRLVRAMPNTAAAVGMSMTALVAASASEAGLELAQKLFSAIGEVVVLSEEALLDPTTALSASGPAFLYLILEALADGGVKAGLPREAARVMAAQTMKGAAQMALQSGRHTADLKDSVTSPAGTTAAGLAVLESRGVRGALIEAIDAASRRAKELGEK